MLRAHLKRITGSRLRLTLFLAGIILLLAPVTVFAVNGFTDVPPTHPHFQGINYLVDKGLTTGYPDGTFRPENGLTRGQMGTFLYRSSGNDPATPPSVNADKVDGLNASQLVAAGATVDVPFIILPGAVTRVDRWFNNVTGTKPTFSKLGSGEYELDFGFDLSGRFVQVTTSPTGLIVLPGKPIVRWATAAVSGTKLRIWTYWFSGGGPVLGDANCHILVY